MILLHVDCDAATVARYECGGEAIRLTHRYVHESAPVNSFGWEGLQNFRSNPPDEYKIDPDPSPTNSPAGAGTNYPCYMEAA